MVENKFFFNHYSLTNENALELFSKLIEGIKYFYSQKKLINNTFYFYTEVESFWEFRLNGDFTIKNLFSSLQSDYQSFFTTFISQSKKIENIFDNDEILEQLPEYDIIPISDGSGEQFYLLSLNADLEGVLLSFNRDIWTESLVEVSKNDTVHDEYSNIFLKNIATKEHAQELIDKDILAQLPMDDIAYSNSFKDWFLAHNTATIEKIISKVIEAEKLNFDIDGFLIKSIDKDIWQIKIGTLGGLQQSAIRVLFKKDTTKIYILHGLVKQGGTTYDYSSDIETAKANYSQLIEELKI